MLFDTNKPTEVERQMGVAARRLKEYAALLSKSQTVPTLLALRDDVQSVAATANNFVFIVAFNALEEHERNGLSKEKLSEKLHAQIAECAALEKQIETSLHDQISKSHAPMSVKNLQTACLGLGIGNHLSVQWTAVGASNDWAPILHMTTYGSRDKSGYQHDSYHIWVRPRGKSLEISTGFAYIPPEENWSLCSSREKIQECLRERLTKDGF